MPPPFIMGGGAYSITLVRTSVRTYVRPVRTKNGFRAISFEYIGVLDSYFIPQVYNHKIQVKFDYGQNPPIIIRVMALDLGTKNGFRAISFEYIGELDSYFIRRYIIIKYRSSSITDKIHQSLPELWPLISV